MDRSPHSHDYQHDSSEPFSNSPQSPPPVAPPVVKRSPSNTNLAGGLFWLVATASLVLAAWFLGPLAIQRYQYAATLGEVSARYDNARQMLTDVPLQDVSLAFELVAQRIKPSVVSIRSSGVISRRGVRTGGGQGSGVIMSSDGFILTNEHVVKDNDKVKINLHDRREFDGVVVGRDEVTDLAVIKIDAGDLLPADWGNSDTLSVGSMVWAVGSPYGLEQTVTSGILSARERGTFNEQTREYLQTDAAVNPGNSGGPLVNARGEVVGINTSIYGEQFQGISFAIPSAIARFVFEQIIENRQVVRSYLGVQPRPVTHRDMTQMDLPDLNGAYVDDIPRNGPAYRTDLRIGDVIRNWDGHEIRTYNMLYRFISMTTPNSTVKVDVLRDGQPLSLNLAVIKRPAERVLQRSMPTQRRQRGRNRDNR